MPALVLALLFSAAPEGRLITDPRGFHFTLPPGFEPFPGFQPTDTKLYAFGTHLGTPQAAILAIDLLEGPTAPGAASRSCGELLNSMDRTVGRPITEPWQGRDLSGLRMTMTQLFGEIAVYCVDVPLTPRALSLKVSGKPANEAFLHDTFRAVLGSMEPPLDEAFGVWVIGLVGSIAVALSAVVFRALRRTPGQ